MTPRDCPACDDPQARVEDTCARCWRARYLDERRKKRTLSDRLTKKYQDAKTRERKLRELLKAHVPGMNDFDIQETLERGDDG